MIHTSMMKTGQSIHLRCVFKSEILFFLFFVSFSDIFEDGDVYSNYVQKLSFKMMDIKIVAMNELLLRLIFIGNVSNIIAVRVEMPSFPITDIFRSKN